MRVFKVNFAEDKSRNFNKVIDKICRKGAYSIIISNDYKL